MKEKEGEETKEKKILVLLKKLKEGPKAAIRRIRDEEKRGKVDITFTNNLLREKKREKKKVKRLFLATIPFFKKKKKRKRENLRGRRKFRT